MTTLKDLTPDPKNRRTHTSRNVEMITEAIASVGTGRSIVIDEDDVVLAGNATVKAAGVAGLTKLKIVEAEGDEVIAVRRRGLTSEQKRALAIYDNRTAELAEWDVEQLVEDVDAGVDLEAFFDENELAVVLDPFTKFEVPLSERPGDDDDERYVDFKFDKLGGKVSREVFESFMTVYKSRQESADAVVLDDVLQAWLGLA
jgi:hypothetical protein